MLFYGYADKIVVVIIKDYNIEHPEKENKGHPQKTQAVVV